MYDFLIIGAGVVGSAIARELSRYNVKVAVLEKNLDVCNEQSGRNSAVIHGGFAYDIGSKKARFCVEGCLAFDKLSKELDIPFERTGKVLVGNTDEDRQRLVKTIEVGRKNGAEGLRLIEEEELKRLVPAVNGKFAMFSPMSGIVDPFIYTIALAENAKANGVDFYFDHEVIQATKQESHYSIYTQKTTFNTRWVINSAGNNCSKVSELLGLGTFPIEGTKGDYIILDKKIGHLLPMPVYPVPTNTYMGIHVTPTMDGNVTVGPNANKVTDYEDYGITQDAIEYLKDDAFNLWPHIHRKDYIRNYSGVQPTWKDEEGIIKDFHIKRTGTAINLIGMESPALTSAVPIAQHVIELIVNQESLSEDADFNPKRKGIVKFSEQSETVKKELIEKNPDYGEIICRCETVTKAEILEAIHNPLGVETVTGIKYRTRAMMGRCQGGYCQMRIAELIQNEKNKKRSEIQYSRIDSYMFTGKVRP